MVFITMFCNADAAAIKFCYGDVVFIELKGGKGDMVGSSHVIGLSRLVEPGLNEPG